MTTAEPTTVLDNLVGARAGQYKDSTKAKGRPVHWQHRTQHVHIDVNVFVPLSVQGQYSNACYPE